MSETCRICGSSAVVEAGQVEYLAGFNWAVYDCGKCGCRFTRHDDSVHEKFHQSGAISYYSDYRDLAQDCRAFFDAGDQMGLRSCLRRSSKYRFVIDQVAGEPASARLLEVGCSRGYVTSCFILEGREVLGVDMSAEAIASAHTAFGDHFVPADSPEVALRAPYDVIYHLGMIGCVADPVGLNRHLLSLLKPGGRLLFNAPNRQALYLRDQLWLDSAPPPDLVTLFPPGFWARIFSSEAQAQETVEMLPGDQSLLKGVHQLCRKRWHPPLPQPMTSDGGRGRTWSQPAGHVWSLLERVLRRLPGLGQLARLVRRQPAEFGLFVTMTKKGGKA